MLKACLKLNSSRQANNEEAFYSTAEKIAKTACSQNTWRYRWISFEPHHQWSSIGAAALPRPHISFTNNISVRRFLSIRAEIWPMSSRTRCRQAAHRSLARTHDNGAARVRRGSTMSLQRFRDQYWFLQKSFWNVRPSEIIEDIGFPFLNTFLSECGCVWPGLCWHFSNII